MIPLLPKYIEQPSLFCQSKCVIEGVVSDQFQMSEVQLQATADEVILCWVLAAEFVRILRTLA